MNKKEFVEDLMSKMTVREKIGQLNKFGNSIYNDDYKIGWDLLRKGMIGSFLGVATPEQANELQKIAVEETRLGIPLIMGFDVIHGFKTIFPVPWAEACSWEPELAQKTAEASSAEATLNGVNMIYAPMVDIARDARWGRTVEGSGEDTFLGSKFAAARVKGIQGDDLSDGKHSAACVKHFVAYGACIGGRDYNSVDMSEQLLFNTYLPPFQAAVDAGSRSLMTAFNDLNGEPCTGSKHLLTEILREKMGFDGVTVSDAGSCYQIKVHGYTADDKETAKKAIEAGLDIEMCFEAATYLDHMESLIDNNEVSMKTLDNAVRRVLELKYDLGLFENPYKNIEVAKEALLTKENRKLALETAQKSIVMLKNNGILPLKNQKIALAGPFADNRKEMLGIWSGAGEADDCVSPADAFGVDVISDCDDFVKYNVVIAFIGEPRSMNGEGRSRAINNVFDADMELLKNIKKSGAKLITVVISGRPLVLKEASELSDALLFSGALGSEAGNAYKSIIYGEFNPSAKLVSSMPYSVGQQPIYYNKNNTGRPCDEENIWSSRYIDALLQPLYPFGFGLSYTSYEYSNLCVSNTTPKLDDSITVSVDVTNVGDCDGEEIVQLYIHDVAASFVRPVKELKGFSKVFIKKGETKKVDIPLDIKSLGFYNRKLEYVVESGKFNIMVGTNSENYLETEIDVL